MAFSNPDHPVIPELERVRTLVRAKCKRARTRVIQKDDLIDIYIGLMTSEGRASLVDVIDELPVPNGKAKGDGYIRAVRKAVQDIQGWIEKHNETEPRNPIKVEFNLDGDVMVNADFVSNKSVKARVACLEARQKLLLSELQIIVKETAALSELIG